MNRKILIVDDERALTQRLCARLTNEGYHVYTANHAQEAMEKLNIAPDLILLDINMPDMDGLEFCAAIRDHISCPILFLTARVTEQDKVTGLLSGGDDYIMQVLLFSLLLLVLPLVLKLTGFDFAGWFSTYPIYKGLMLFR